MTTPTWIALLLGCGYLLSSASANRPHPYRKRIISPGSDPVYEWALKDLPPPAAEDEYGPNKPDPQLMKRIADSLSTIPRDMHELVANKLIDAVSDMTRKLSSSHTEPSDGTDDLASLELELSMSMMSSMSVGTAAIYADDLEYLQDLASLELSMSMMSSMSVPGTATIYADDLEYLKLTLAEFSMSAMLMSMSVSPTGKPTTYSPSTPWPSYLPTTSPVVSQPLAQNTFTSPPTLNAKAAKAPPKDPTISTPAPSVSAPPTESPTQSQAPTLSPSKPPTIAPSQSPSTSPTKAPSLSPSTGAPSHSPTRAPTSSPTVPSIDVETNLQLRLEVMSGIMDDEAADVFEQSCETFLGVMLDASTPPVFDVECEVTDQELELVRRRLSTPERHMEAATPLLVDVNVKGSTTETSSVNDEWFGDLVYGTFSANSQIFVNQLTADGTEAEIDDFVGLSTVYAIEPYNDGLQFEHPDSANNLEGSGNSSEGNDTNDEMTKNGAIAAIVICGVAMLAMFVAFFIHVSRRNREEAEEAGSVASDVEDVYQNTVFAMALDSAEMASKISAEEEASVFSGSVEEGLGGEIIGGNDNLSYVYSLDDGLATPRSALSPQAASVSSLTDQIQQQTPKSTDTGPTRVRKDILAPQGKLGIIIDTCNMGPIVHSVKANSPLEGLIQEGDLVVGIDDEDTREWSAHYLTKLVAKKSNCERKITVLRIVKETEKEESIDVLNEGGEIIVS